MENKIEARHLNLYYGQKHALKDVSLDIKENKITAFIVPSGCGKSTFLKTLNRMNDYVDNVKIEGDVILDGEDIYDSRVDTTLLRKKVGMVFQQPNPFPMSIYDNVAYGPRIHGIKNKKQLDKIVEDMKSTVQDATDAAKQAGEDEPEVAVEADSAAPELFNDIKDKNKDLFPAAWAMYKNSANLDAENDKLDKEQAAEKIEQSYAASFGKAINPVLEPLGFDWKMGLSLVAGLAAKEVVISTLGTIYAVGGDDQNPAPLTEYLQNDPHFTPLIGLTMMLFILIYPPCLATLAVIKRETGSWKWVAFMFFYENAFAWTACFIFYNVGRALGF